MLARNIFPSKHPVILMYHRVEKELFERQMEYLKKNYTVVSLKDIPGLLKKDEIKPNTVAITFDDGYQNNYENAYPALKQHELPATVFVTVDNVEKNLFAWWDRLEHTRQHINPEYLKTLSPTAIEEQVEQLTKLSLSDKPPVKYSFMGWNTIKQIQDVFDIGSHTLSHPILTTVSDKDAKWEITESKRRLEQLLQRKITLFAYPNGNFTGRASMVREAGYQCAVITAAGKNTKETNPFLLRRKGINSGDDKAVLAAKLAGLL